MLIAQFDRHLLNFTFSWGCYGSFLMNKMWILSSLGNYIACRFDWWLNHFWVIGHWNMEIFCVSFTSWTLFFLSAGFSYLITIYQFGCFQHILASFLSLIILNSCLCCSCMVSPKSMFWCWYMCSFLLFQLVINLLYNFKMFCLVLFSWSPFMFPCLL